MNAGKGRVYADQITDYKGVKGNLEKFMDFGSAYTKQNFDNIESLFSIHTMVNSNGNFILSGCRMGVYKDFGNIFQSVSTGKSDFLLNRDKSNYIYQSNSSNEEETKFILINRLITIKPDKGWYRYKKGFTIPEEVKNIKIYQFEKPAVKIIHW